MSGWGEYAAAWTVFLLSHMLPLRPWLRSGFVALLGERGFVGAYSLVSLVVMAWLIVAAGRAPHLPLWGWAAWQAWVPNLIMRLACVLLALGIGIPNPFSIGGAGPERFDPMRPGVLALTRQPVLLAIVFWTAAHIPPNGDLAMATLFGALAAMGLFGMRALDARRRRAWGQDRWLAMSRRSGSWLGAFPQLATTISARRVAMGLVGWLMLFSRHAAVLGVSPLPILN